MSSEIEPQAGGSDASGEERSVPHRVVGTPQPTPAAVDPAPGEVAVQQVQTEP